MYITSQIILEEVAIPEIAQLDVLGIDIETRGMDPKTSTILSIQIGSPNNVWVIDARKVNVAPLFSVLSQTNPLVIGHNLKFDLSFLISQYGYTPARLYDTMIAYGILHNGLESPYVSLRQLVGDHFEVKLDKDVRETFKYVYGDLTDKQIEYAGNDVKYLCGIFEDQLERLRLDNLIRIAQLEFDLVPVVVDMELTGIRLDQDKWLEAMEKSLRKASEIELQIQEVIGGGATQSSFFGTPKSTINPRSSKQMLDAFHSFDRKIESTSASVLKYVDHPLAKLLLSYRESYKLGSTYGRNFLELVQDDGRIHAEFNQLGARSGRFSSSGPCLHNIPGAIFYRSCFISGKDMMMITADWSQIEYKIAALMSGETSIINEYKKKGADFHSLTAADIYGVPQSEVSTEQRDVGKTTNFGVIYMISKYGLARRLDIKVDKADKIIKNHRKTYPKLTAFMESSAALGVSQGYNTTKLGRRRYYQCPPISDPEYRRKISFIRREAGNNPIQGTAAEIMKRALIDVAREIKQYDAHILSTIHDEMLVETPKEHTSFVLGIVNDKMEKAGEEIMGNEITWDVSLAVGGHWKKA